MWGLKIIPSFDRGIKINPSSYGGRFTKSILGVNKIIILHHNFANVRDCSLLMTWERQRMYI